MQRTATLAALAREYDELLALVDELGPTDWDRPSLCEGWSCRDVLAHVVSTDRAVTTGRILLWHMPGRDAQAAGDKAIEAWRERSIAELRGTAEVMGRRLLKLLWGASRVAWDARVPTPFGRLPVRALAEERIHDLWVHNRDISVAVEMGEPDARRTAASLGWMRSVLPSRLRPALEAHVGREVFVRVGGGVSTAFRWQIGSAEVTDFPVEDAWSEPPKADVTITLDADTFVVCGSGRREPTAAARGGDITIQGDPVLAESFLRALPVLA
jgi:uncharacterized protein (TIGR03083 family)